MNSPALLVLGLLVMPAGLGAFALAQRSTPQGRPTRVPAAQQSAERPANTPGFRVAGLQVNSPVHTGADPASDETFGIDLAFFGTFSRTSLAIEFTREAGGIIGIDDDRSRLARFTDDRGTDLVRKDSFGGPFEGMPRISSDGRHLVFALPSDALPDAGATRLGAAGVLGVRVGDGIQDFVARDVDLQQGETFSLGGFDFRIESAGPSEWGEGHALTLSSKRDLAGIVRYALILDDGREHPLDPSMSMSGMGAWQQSFEMERAIERASLRITCWKNLQVLEIPFEVQAGIGLR